MGVKCHRSPGRQLNLDELHGTDSDISKMKAVACAYLW